MCYLFSSYVSVFSASLVELCQYLIIFWSVLSSIFKNTSLLRHRSIATNYMPVFGLGGTWNLDVWYGVCGCVGSLLSIIMSIAMIIII